MGIVSDSFNLSFSKTLDRVLDLRNFFDMNKDYLNKYHKQIALLRNSCTSLLNFPDAYGVTAEDFEDTLYKHSYITLGLDTANVYKMDDGNLQEYLDYEFPGTTLRVLNKRRSATTELLESSKDLSRIAKADEYFMNKYKYTL